ncbi:MAG: flagellin [Thermodesulfobacteriota bacterium]|nr:flagellin [Thermodesulfobacteriota bacterium]
MDVDFSEEVSNFAKLKILTETGSFVLAQANALPETVLALLQGGE